jgi:hypothetical protein
LALPPTWYRIDSPRPDIDVVVTQVNGQAITVYLRDSSGRRLTEGAYDLRWEARI